MAAYPYAFSAVELIAMVTISVLVGAAIVLALLASFASIENGP